MPHPKRRKSVQKKRQRRGAISYNSPTFSRCPTTGVLHIAHTAHWYEGKLYHKGNIILTKNKKKNKVGEKKDENKEVT